MSVLCFKRQVGTLLCACAVLLVSGCATGPTANPKDPLEPINRKIAIFNDSVDENVTQPLARGYRDYTPKPLQTGLHNFFNNLSDVRTTLNSGLQLKGKDTAESFMRVVVNTVFGIYGVFDVASEIKLQRHNEDFGQTLGYWGVGSGPYVVLPLFGPSTVRDAGGFIVDATADAVHGISDVATRNQTTALRLVDKRAGLLDAGNLLNEASLDKYSFTRDAFLQYRRSQIYDGNPPEEDEPDYSVEPESAK
jgi:phospholipid-binding lipoprotein MlaA